MDHVSADLARVKAERRRLTKLAWHLDNAKRVRRARAWRVGTIAFCHVPMAGESIATAIVCKYGDAITTDETECALELERRFLNTPVDMLAQWLDWIAEDPQTEVVEAKRLVEEVRLLAWVQSQNAAQGVAPPPQFVWEQRCSLSIQNTSHPNAHASPLRPPRSAGARKWVQRFRRRWGLVLGRLPVQDMLTVDTMRAKVALFFSRFFPKNNTPRPAWRTHFGCQKTDPISGA